MPPLHDHLHEAGSPPSGPPLSEIASVVLALAPGAAPGASVDHGLALLAHVLEDHHGDATTAAVLLSGAVPRLLAALQSPQTSAEGCAEGLRALVMLLDIKMRDPARRVGAGSGSAAGAPPPAPQQHDADPSKCAVCNADPVAARTCASVVARGAPRAAGGALRLHPASERVAYLACASLYLAAGVDQRARGERRDYLKAVGAHAAVIAAARRFPRDLKIAEQAASALFSDEGGRAAAVAAGGVALLLEAIEAFAPMPESDWLLDFACQALLYLEVKVPSADEPCASAVPAEAVAPLVRALGCLAADARRDTAAVAKVSCLLANVAGSEQRIAEARLRHASRADRYRVALREGAARHIVAALEVHMHCPKATGELLYALHRVVLEGREPPLKQAGVLADSGEYMALVDEQMLVYVDLVGDARIVQLVVRALDAHPEDERVAYIGASALGELYGPQWAGMVVGAEAFAKAGLRVDMQDEGGARARARARAPRRREQVRAAERPRGLRGRAQLERSRQGAAARRGRGGRAGRCATEGLRERVRMLQRARQGLHVLRSVHAGGLLQPRVPAQPLGRAQGGVPRRGRAGQVRRWVGRGRGGGGATVWWLMRSAFEIP